MMIRRLVRLSDKQIGRRCYFVNTEEMELYLNQLNKSRNRHLSQYNTSDTLSDSICMQNQEIKGLKMDILNLHARINDLTNIVSKNHNNVEDQFIKFSIEVRKEIDKIGKK